MNKFTIFTIILSISTITVMADLVIRDYFGAEETGNRIQDTGKEAESEETVIETDQPPTASSESFSSVLNTPSSVTLPQPETRNPQPSTTVTLEKIREAGFTGEFTEKHFNGKVFQLLDITQTPVDAIGFYEISQDVGPVASVVEIALRDEIRALQLYSLLQNKTKPYIDLTLNETNAYGDRSFYINHAKKPNEAFLTVKIGKMIYAFAYVKFYHPEVKELIQMLTP